jgi:2-(1,2-epoxy-1,2-dihydrophenyl)acetyl-CoA isomerase
LADNVLIERHGPVAVIRLNDPKTRNALNPEMIENIAGYLQTHADDVRAIVFAGSARTFSSGANLWGGAAFDLDAPDFDAGELLATLVNPMMQSLKDSKVPIVSAVRGAAVGVGASLALAADIVIAGADAFFVPAFSHIGLAPDSGAPFLLARSIGRVRAMELLLLGDRLPAAKALEWGLITRVVDDAAVEAEALAFAAKLAQGPTRALAMTRQAAWAGATLSWEEELQLECRLQNEAVRTADFREGMSAFAEKRPPRFTGK